MSLTFTLLPVPPSPVSTVHTCAWLDYPEARNTRLRTGPESSPTTRWRGEHPADVPTTLVGNTTPGCVRARYSTVSSSTALMARGGGCRRKSRASLVSTAPPSVGT